MNPELAALYAKLDIYHQALVELTKDECWECAVADMAAEALDKATKLSQPASQPEKPKPKKPWVTNS